MTDQDTAEMAEIDEPGCGTMAEGNDGQEQEGTRVFNTAGFHDDGFMTEFVGAGAFRLFPDAELSSDIRTGCSLPIHRRANTAEVRYIDRVLREALLASTDPMSLLVPVAWPAACFLHTKLPMRRPDFPMLCVSGASRKGITAREEIVRRMWAIDRPNLVLFSSMLLESPGIFRSLFESNSIPRAVEVHTHAVEDFEQSKLWKAKGEGELAERPTPLLVISEMPLNVPGIHIKTLEIDDPVVAMLACLPWHKIGRRILADVLETSDDELVSLYKQELLWTMLDPANCLLPDVIEVVAILRTGLRMLERVLGSDLPFDRRSINRLVIAE